MFRRIHRQLGTDVDVMNVFANIFIIDLLKAVYVYCVCSLFVNLLPNRNHSVGQIKIYIIFWACKFKSIYSQQFHGKLLTHLICTAQPQAHTLTCALCKCRGSDILCSKSFCLLHYKFTITRWPEIHCISLVTTQFGRNKLVFVSIFHSSIK